MDFSVGISDMICTAKIIKLDHCDQYIKVTNILKNINEMSIKEAYRSYNQNIKNVFNKCKKINKYAFEDEHIEKLLHFGTYKST